MGGRREGSEDESGGRSLPAADVVALSGEEARKVAEGNRVMTYLAICKDKKNDIKL